MREVAGILTALDESMTDPSVAERLRAWGPWGQAIRRRMRPRSAGETLPAGRRLVVIDARRLQAPGATGPAHRRPSAMALRPWQVLEGLVSDGPTGDTRTPGPLGGGEVAGAARGYAQAQGLREAVQRGAERLVRLTPFSVGRCAPTEQPLAWCAAVKRPHTDTIRTLEVVLQSPCGQQTVRGGVHASRCSAEHAGRARPPCRQRHTQGAPTAERLVLAGWVVVLTPRSPAGLSAQTILGLSRWRWPGAIAIQRGNSGLDVAALRATAPRPLAEGWLHGTCREALRLERRLRRLRGDSWGRLAQARLETWWRVWGMRKEERAPMMTGALLWKDAAWATCLQVLAARPRRRQ